MYAKQFTSKAVKKIFRSFGFELERAKFGHQLDSDLKSLLKNPSLILDIGANEGQTAEWFAQRFPYTNIFSFEPSPSVFPKLVANTKRYKNVSPFNIGLGNENSSKTLFINEKGSKMSSVLDKNPSIGWGNIIAQEDIQIVSLDSFLEGKRQFIDLLKIDTEGFDLEVLKGAKSLLEDNKIKLILTEVRFVEFNIGQGFFEDIYLFLQQFEFKLVGLYRCNYKEHKYILWCDALFINPFI